MSNHKKNGGYRWYHLIDPKAVLVVLALVIVAAVTVRCTMPPLTQPQQTLPTQQPWEPEQTQEPEETREPEAPTEPQITLDSLPAYSGEPYVVLYGNMPQFDPEDLTSDVFEDYARLDHLGRCGAAFACIGRELMPTENRESIAGVTPSGWKNAKYDFVEAGYLYNRCHLIGYQLTGENSNKCNLITGTRYLNIQGMLPFENMVADHIQEEGHRVLFRVTPIFEGDDLVASGVTMEAYCLECGEEAAYEEDKFLFHVYCYNVQPGVVIDYATGESQEADPVFEGEVQTYILNNASMKFHLETCSGAATMKEKNKEIRTCTREELIYLGYSPCGSCEP